MFLENNIYKQQIVDELIKIEKNKINKLDEYGVPIYKVIIIDMTNMTIESRKLPTPNNLKIFNKYKIKKIVIKFNWDIVNKDNKIILYKLAEIRNEFTKKTYYKSKTIPYKAIKRILNSYEKIDKLKEYFDKIIYINTIPNMLKKLETY